MSKTKFRFNTETLEYEKVKVNYWALAWKTLAFVSIACIIGLLGVGVAFKWLVSPNELKLHDDIKVYQQQVQLLDQKTSDMQKLMSELASMDESVYREIFEADPIPSDVRKAATGGIDKYSSLSDITEGNSLVELHKKLDGINSQTQVQKKSYDQLIKLAKAKAKMLASIPAIQPVANKDLKRVASGFGYRIDPIYRTRKMHTGIDFTAPKGTKVYATGDGVVKKVKRARWGYGTHIVISHGYGYTTLYGHLSRTNVRPGQKVTRGQLIGLIGSTGKSTGPHLHYEVSKNGKHVNPVGYFYNDLTASEYEQILKLSSNSNQSFD